MRLLLIPLFLMASLASANPQVLKIMSTGFFPDTWGTLTKTVVTYGDVQDLAAGYTPDGGGDFVLKLFIDDSVTYTATVSGGQITDETGTRPN